MTFDVREVSNYGGSPITLYEFHRNSSGLDFYWRYNTSDADVTVSGNVFKAVAISDDGVRQSGEATESEFNVTMPMNEDVPAMFRTSAGAPSDTIFLTVFRIHDGDTDAIVEWVGTVASMAQQSETTVKFVCNVLLASFKRGGLRLSWARGCPHALYDNQCKANPEDNKIVATVSAVSGNTITAPSFTDHPSTWLDGGFLAWTLTSGIVERRWIKSHTGDTIVISGTTAGLQVGDTVQAYAGCDHTRTGTNGCLPKFNNMGNYGGFPHMPGRSPFSGDPIF